jgi:hypothetical protein
VSSTKIMIKSRSMRKGRSVGFVTAFFGDLRHTFFGG